MTSTIDGLNGALRAAAELEHALQLAANQHGQSLGALLEELSDVGRRLPELSLPERVERVLATLQTSMRRDASALAFGYVRHRPLSAELQRDLGMHPLAVDSQADEQPEPPAELVGLNRECPTCGAGQGMACVHFSSAAAGTLHGARWSA